MEQLAIQNLREKCCKYEPQHKSAPGLEMIPLFYAPGWILQFARRMVSMSLL